MTQITESGGRQNIFPTEPAVLVDSNYTSYPEDAEKVNGRWAMIGIVALLGAYVTTGQIIPGIF
ncbi:MAG: high light inducible protein [uncultured marine virus]|jgi:hypothetical protein|nr:MAG: high light inducible protein [uncultured marine virus]|tara:strand:+ start:741 stop:932 length:192 start_codon:yes stop_codon:yes gene_type:complete